MVRQPTRGPNQRPNQRPVDRPIDWPIDWNAYAAVLFDLDGVITPTAEVHERAWSELFREHGFTLDDYHAYVDGKPRYDGVRSFLASRGITLPEGSPDDAPGDATVCALGNKKNVLFNELIEHEGITAYPGSIRLLDVLDELGTPQAIVSSSKNARQVLRAAGLDDRFDVVVDGVTLVDEGLDGKPSPAMFLRAAELLHAPADRTVVVEDAVSGVAAGRAGGFALVLGVARNGNDDALRANGADIVVADHDEALEEDRSS
jgi:beta-phosphoglucomutase family hydrolase